MNTITTTTDEYIDYSCSTSVERLARDVETSLRSWHVDKGSDRHISVKHPGILAGENTNTNNDRGTAATAAAIRSQVLEWTLSFHSHQRISATLPLELVLWDSSASSSSNEVEGLPYSLQQRDKSLELPSNTLDNFSTVFGFGQHITLTPVQPTAVSDDLWQFLSRSVAQRHDPEQTAPSVLTSILTGWLQSALNLAASSCSCCFPLIGVWGLYKPQKVQEGGVLSVFPSWVELSLVDPATTTTTSSKRMNISPRRRKRRQQEQLNQNYLPPVLTGQLRSEDCKSTFWCSVLKAGQKWTESSSSSGGIKWTTWASVLLRHCRHQSHETVNLWAARHVYSWYKQAPQRGLLSTFRSSGQSEWRKNSSSQRGDKRENIETYRRECRNVALWLLEQAARTTDTNPLWGPSKDPVASIHAIVTWNSPRKMGIPLLALPIQTRSDMDPAAYNEMEQAVANSVLDTHQPSEFAIKTFYDPDTNEASLAASLRCVLAALIRASTLPRETLLGHLIDETVIEEWDNEAGNHIALSLAKRASVDDTTLALVAAMDWDHAMESMMDLAQAEERVQEVMDSRLGLEFPSPPDQMHAQQMQTDDWKALLKSAPPGRLVSLLFVHMANVRSAPSMALVWKCFVDELRQRWERHESLPNMNYVPGLDPPVDSYTTKQCFSTVGSKANFASLVHCSEPDPDDGNCLVGQKLQVFNICLESIVAEEMREIEQMEKKRQKLGEEHAAMFPSSRVSNGAIIDRTPDGSFGPRDGDVDSTTYSNKSPATHFMSAYYDADEGSVDGVLNGGGTARKGARCPVLGASLSKTGDQLYAPYLQRPYPLTDDVIAQRQIMMRRQKGAKASATIKQRIEIAQRLQRPKLLSDMQAFKAANPGAVFQDFVGWYGNPDNPLENFETDLPTGHLGTATLASIGVKLDKASEAIRVLDETRTFWTRTWDEADACPAMEQDPLFDAANTVEMTLDFLETIHPAILLCQVMAVNLAMAYFTLVVSAEDAVMVGVVRTSLVRLRESVVNALGLLSQDATQGERTSFEVEGSSLVSIVSIDSLAACGRACIHLSEAEVQVSRAKSLLHKLPKQTKLVDKIMRQPNGARTEVVDSARRRAILNSIAQRQLGLSTVGSTAVNIEPKPTMREYILRNNDDLEPCQLCVKYNDENPRSPNEECADILVALTLTERHKID